jgi:putative DNA primase/helicase
LLPAKNNLARDRTGLAFRLVQQVIGDPGNGIETSAIAWENEPVTMSADEALSLTSAGHESRSAQRDAENFLRDLLAEGPVPAKEGEQAARALGIATRTLKRARKTVGVIALKSGLDGGWTLQLPIEIKPGQGGQECQRAEPDTVGTVGPLRDAPVADESFDAGDPGPSPDFWIGQSR